MTVFNQRPDVWTSEKERIENLIRKLYRIPSYVSELQKYELLELRAYFQEVLEIPIEDPYNHIAFEVTETEHIETSDARFSFQKHHLAPKTSLSGDDTLYLFVAKTIYTELEKKARQTTSKVDENHERKPEKENINSPKEISVKQSLLVLELLAEQEILPDYRLNNKGLLAMIVRVSNKKDLYQKMGNRKSMIDLIENLSDGQKSYWRPKLNDIKSMFNEVYLTDPKMDQVKKRIRELCEKAEN